MTAESNSIKKKRNRVRRSCNFCHLKHLKCNREKPICDNCVERKNNVCEYEAAAKVSPKSGKKSVAKPSKTSTFNIPEYKKNKTLDKYIMNRYVPNPILDKYSSHLLREDGRLLFFGPTCYRTTIYQLTHGNKDPNSKQLERIYHVWDILKANSKPNPRENKLSYPPVTKEVEIINKKQFHKSSYTLLEHLILVIPNTKSEIIYYLNLHFDTTLAHAASIINKQAIMNYVDELFVTNETSQIVGIRPDKNLYKLGIILYILGLTFYNLQFPERVLKFFIFIQGQSTAELMYFEKVQYLALKCFFSFSNGQYGADFSHLINMVNDLCHTAISFQLNKLNVVEIYKNDPELNEMYQKVGMNDYGMLKRIYYVVLYIDVLCSFQNGKSLCITNTDYCEEWLLISEYPDESGYCDATQCEILNMIKKNVYHARKLINELYKPYGYPVINNLLNKYTDFIHAELGLNELCDYYYQSDEMFDTIQTSLLILKSFFCLFALQSVISILGIKKDIRFNDESEAKSDEEYQLLNDNLIIYYCLCTYHVTCSFLKAVDQCQFFYKQGSLMRNSIKKFDELKSPLIDRHLFLLSVNPGFLITLRMFTEFSRLLLQTKLFSQDCENNYKFVNTLLNQENYNIEHLKSRNDYGRLLKDLLTKHNVMNIESLTEPSYLPRNYDYFHPAMFQMDANGNHKELNSVLKKMRFTGVQLYGWFKRLYNMCSIFDAYMKKGAENLNMNTILLDAKEKFLTKYFNTFLENIQNQDIILSGAANLPPETNESPLSLMKEICSENHEPSVTDNTGIIMEDGVDLPFDLDMSFMDYTNKMKWFVSNTMEDGKGNDPLMELFQSNNNDK